MRNSLNLKQAANLIATVGDKRSVILQGHVGTGKSSILNVLAKQFPGHIPCYLDATTKDLGDLMLPKMVQINGQDVTRFAPNEEFGIHTGQPVILMIDEFGKANRSVQNALLRMLLERKIGVYTLPPGSIVFGTTNLAGEGVGDNIQAHARNRIVFVEMRKPTSDEWIEWASNNDIAPEVLAWVHETPQVFADFRDVKQPDSNPYIFHNAEARPAFVTPRSLEAASVLVSARDQMDANTLQCALAGTVGVRAAADMQAFISLADQLPLWKDIIKDPKNVNVPKDAAARCMLVFTAMGRVEASTFDAWMDYMDRLPKEAQAMFAVQIHKTDKRPIAFTNKRFIQWAVQNNYAFA